MRGRQSVSFDKVFGLFNEESLRGIRPNLPKLASAVLLGDAAALVVADRTRWHRRPSDNAARGMWPP